MKRIDSASRRLRPGSLLLPGLLAGCSHNPENDPLIVVGTVVAYAVFFAFFGFIIYRAIWGPDGPR